jgi:hypothetical protein
MENIDLVFLFVIAAFFGYYMCKSKSLDSFEGFAAIDDARQAVREIYNADVDAIRGLTEVAKKLQAGGLTHPGKLTVNGGNDNVPMVVQSNTDSHILLRTKNDGNKDSYLINRDGHLRVHMAGVGDQFGVNHDGHLYNEHTGDHVAHHIGRGANPYITLSRAGQWGNSSWYMQNVHNGNPANSTFRIGKHDVGAKLDIGSDGYLNAAGARLGGEISTGSNATINGRASFGGPMSEGIVNIKNRDGRYTHFNWPDGQNYIRGNTIIDGTVTVNGRDILAELNRLNARFPNNYTLDLTGGQINQGGGYFHMMGPGGVGSKEVAARNFLGGWGR